jgi:hypothetical protein
VIEACHEARIAQKQRNPGMFISLWHILLRSVSLAISYMGTTALAIGIGLLLFTLRIFRAWKRDGKDTMLKR